MKLHDYFEWLKNWSGWGESDGPDDSWADTLLLDYLKKGLYMDGVADGIAPDKDWSIGIDGKELDPSICGVMLYQRESTEAIPLQGCSSLIRGTFNRNYQNQFFLVPIQRDEKCKVIGTPRVRFFRWRTTTGKPGEPRPGSRRLEDAVEVLKTKPIAENLDYEESIDTPPPHLTDLAKRSELDTSDTRDTQEEAEIMLQGQRLTADTVRMFDSKMHEAGKRRAREGRSGGS